ncbi:hypothetical protein P7L93_24670, partial [Vibrio parahaemolyticus]|nr:hypothetical protein [Vibrio parahaemolyticus]
LGLICQPQVAIRRTAVFGTSVLASFFSPGVCYPGNPEFSLEHNLNLLSESLWQSVMMLITHALVAELHQSHRWI